MPPGRARVEIQAKDGVVIAILKLSRVGQADMLQVLYHIYFRAISSVSYGIY